ncbi:MAG TPA: MFS transporter [Actinophytocola sp.]|uniref:MFS transporter n=1 Tax=Actinophytocola sp. TaxID=1872138 RepID=UPI002DDC926E|nr:MFS transporter [Actinophytocola sp.]HEV2780521.1 MFS transporter [Actinophytocola sp.]
MTIDEAAIEPAKRDTSTAAPAPPCRTAGAVALLRIPALRRLFLARTISLFGDMIVPVALAFAVLDFGGGATGLGIVLAARVAPEVLLLLLGGAVGDRYPRRAVLIVSNGVACLAQLLTGLLFVSGSAAIWSIAALAAVTGATSAFFTPASTAAIAHVAPDDERQAAYALFVMTANAAEVAGPSLAGVLLLVANPGWIIVLDAASFLVSAILVGRAGTLGKQAVATAGRSLAAEIMSGLRYVRQTRWLSALIASAGAFQLFLLATLSVLGPLVAHHDLGGPSAWAAIAAALGAGGIVGSALAMRVRPKRPLLVGYSLLLLGSGPTLILLAVPAPTMILVATEFVAGIVIAYFESMEAATIANRVPGTMLSRVDSVNRFGSMVLRPIGMACIGPVAVAVGLRPALVTAGVLTLMCVAAPLLLRDVRVLRD